MEREPIKATLEITYDSEREARLVASALSPDNLPLPEGLRLSMYVEERRLVSEIECTRPISSILNTLDDILCMVSLINKVLSEIKRL
ncbi:MAG: KEOPS complex subunit Pcc1 [Nitrososphaerota archaeon]